MLLILISLIALVGYFDPDRVRNIFVRQTVAEAVSEPVVKETNGEPKGGKKPRPDVEALDLTRSDAILVIESDDVFTPAGANALRQMVKSLESLP